MPDESALDVPPPVHASAFRHVWAPRRLAWWIALLFAIGAGLFTLGGLAAAWPTLAPGRLGAAAVQNRIFAVGAVFFTTAAWLQWLEAINGDVARAFSDSARARWRWIGWLPRNLGYLASGVQLVGTVMFNLDTVEATRTGLGWERDDLLVWTPDMLGCACFLISSCLAYAEVSHGAVYWAPRSVSWWIAVANLVGSVAFQVSALYAFEGPEPAGANASFWAAFYTAAGGLCFLLGAYLMIPEVFDETIEATSPP